MKLHKENGFRASQMYAIGGLLLLLLITANPADTSDSSENVQKPVTGEQPFTLKTDPLTGQVHFNTKTVDISVLNRQKDRENAQKVAIVKKDLQSRIKIADAEEETSTSDDAKEEKTEDPTEVLKKQVMVKEDLESRIAPGDDDKKYRAETDRFYDDYKHPIKRSDAEYYDKEPMTSEDRQINLPQGMITQPPKEEESFFSIFESLFGSSDEKTHSETSNVNENQQEDKIIRQNIKTVESILKPIRTHEELQMKSGYNEYEDPQEYRIINEYPQQQSFRPNEQRPYHYTYQRPNSGKPFRPYRPQPTPGYEDYDLEEFVDKKKDAATEKLSTSKATSTSETLTTTTTAKTFSNTNRPKTPTADKKTNDTVKIEKPTEKVTYYTIKPTTEKQYHIKPDFEANKNEVKPEKIQDSANFYNLINLPVRYSTKDTAIPLISTSYANTKIQGMGAHKYEKTNNGKYPNHKYDAVTNLKTATTTTKRPNYWSARRTTTQRPITTQKNIPTSKKTTTTTEFDIIEFDDLAIGSSANFGGFGNKAGAATTTETRVPYDRNTEITTRGVSDVEKKETATDLKTTQKTTSTPIRNVYDDYEYESFPAVVEEVKPPKESKIKLHSSYSYSDKNKIYETSESTYIKNYNRTTTSAPSTDLSSAELPEYEYYEYEMEITQVPSTTASTTTTTPKYRVKYPSLQKDKIKTTTEKVAVVIPTKDQDIYVEKMLPNAKIPTKQSLSTTTTTTAITTTTTTPKPTTQSTISEPAVQQQEESNIKEIYSHFYKPKEPAPVFEETDEDDYTPRPMLRLTRKPTTERTTQVKPIIVTATKKDQENNVNIVLVPMKDPQKEIQRQTIRMEQTSTVPVRKTFTRPSPGYNQNYDYTTEFTVGAVHGHDGGVPVQGHFVASLMSANPYEDDEPFRPIPKPPGLSTGFQVGGDLGDQKKTAEIQATNTEKRPLPPQLNFEESEPIHEPHEFIPSPQFHRPGDVKLDNSVQPGPSEISVDYDFDGIQTEPKPGQYVIFSKPQLNPEMNEGQLKKKPETSSVAKIPTVSHYPDKANIFPDGQKQTFYSTKPGHFYTAAPEIKSTTTTTTTATTPTTEKLDLKRKPSFHVPPELTDDRLSLQLMPPKGFQTENPFEGNFVTPEYEKTESAANYPRPHWEKNGKPTFFLNSAPSKNEINRQPLFPPQMAPTLIPPSSAVPQRFRKPPPPHMPPIRKNFNDGTIGAKPKPNLPNILPQFRPNAKIGTGSYQRLHHRPQGYANANRRNGPNRYHDKENNFPYHIHHPADKDAIMHRDFELEHDVYPKFITNRGKIPQELLEPHAMHKRYGGGPPNVATMRIQQQDAENPKFLRRLQRTPVTTLQMLQQTPGVRTHKNPVLREDSDDHSVPMVPPVYHPYKEHPATERNIHLVYPSNVDKAYHLERQKFDPFNYGFAKPEDQYPLLNPTRRTNQDKTKLDFPYGFVKRDDMLNLATKHLEENGMTSRKNMKVSNEEREMKPNLQDYMPAVTKKPIPSPETKDERIDMNLHMQSNNQWNKVSTGDEDLIIITQNPLDDTKQMGNGKKTPEDGKRKSHNGIQIRINPPSEYHTSITNENDSAFTLGAVMHAIPEVNKKGQVASVSLNEDLIRNLDVNQRISNGKIVMVSMPLDIKDDPKDEKTSYNFQAPFQASSSISSNGAEPTNHGWSIVKKEGDKDTGNEETPEGNGNRNATKFNFENFKPELIGGFKPIYELPEDESETPSQTEEAEDGEKKR